ncbi:MAG: family 43 glycosylhydrolase, partial [Fibrella sp.]|nr:family 43 glycosylhydrolase [Armatimonadota bacterium]
MSLSLLCLAALSLLTFGVPLIAHALETDTNKMDTNKKAENPILYADVPDIAVIRVGDTYYMSSTTMHMSPGLPIMKSRDLVNWEMASYAYETLGDTDKL